MNLKKLFLTFLFIFSTAQLKNPETDKDKLISWLEGMKCSVLEKKPITPCKLLGEKRLRDLRNTIEALNLGSDLISLLIIQVVKELLEGGSNLKPLVYRGYLKDKTQQYLFENLVSDLEKIKIDNVFKDTVQRTIFVNCLIILDNEKQISDEMKDTSLFKELDEWTQVFLLIETHFNKDDSLENHQETAQDLFKICSKISSK